LKRVSLFIFISCAISGGVAHAATYYVSQSGSNNNSCAQATSASTPKSTIAGGIGCLSGGGDTLLIRGGTYNEYIFQTQNTAVFPSGSSWSNKVRIAAYPGETVWMAPTSVPNNHAVINMVSGARYVEFDGINVDARSSQANGINTGANGNGVEHAHHLRFQNAEVITGDCGVPLCIISGINLGQHNIGPNSDIGGYEVINMYVHGAGGPNARGYAVYVSGPNNLVENSDLVLNNAGVHIYNGGGDSADNNVIRNNRIHGMRQSTDFGRAWGILVAGNNNEVYNNIVYDNSVAYQGNNASIFVFYGSNNKIYNNTIYGNNMEGINIAGSSTGTLNTDVRNNIVFANSQPAFINGGNGTNQQNNLMDGTNPLFVNPSAGNFQLQPNSQAIDAGTRISIVTTDFVGVTRPEGGGVDIGAYEYRPAQSAAAPPAPSGLRIVAN
jgi:Right handed beta helix region